MEPPLSYPPAARERMLRIALAEWEEWGRRERLAGALSVDAALGIAAPRAAIGASRRTALDTGFHSDFGTLLGNDASGVSRTASGAKPCADSSIALGGVSCAGPGIAFGADSDPRTTLRANPGTALGNTSHADPRTGSGPASGIASGGGANAILGNAYGGVPHATPGAAPTEAPPEADPANFPRVLAYWRALEDDGGAVARNRPLYAATLSGRPGEGGALWREPAWSAAFISFVLRGAGVDRREFPGDAAHGGYIDALIRDAERFPALAPFVPREPGAYAPRPGDLACADRGPDPITDWRQRAADRGRFRPMHCDIVVEGGPGFVLTVGGNLGDAVVRTRFPADASGYLLPPPPGGPIWFAVFENRLGRLPPWNVPRGESPAASHPPPGSFRP